MLTILLVTGCAVPGTAAAEPVSFSHGTLDNQLTTKQPNAPSGFTYDARYHAANDPSADPPYMRRMVSQTPGLRRDTSVPERCTASDLELALRGPAACPPGSRLGGGNSTSVAFGSPTTVELDSFNAEGEQIILARSPLLTTIVRGQIHPDGSVEFAAPTCYPSVRPAGCPVDNVLQVESHMNIPAYTNAGRSYITTPGKCPKAGHWETTIHFWWADGSEDTVVAKQPCSRPAAQKKPRRTKTRRR
jgi:hypothetical protein